MQNVLAFTQKTCKKPTLDIANDQKDILPIINVCVGSNTSVSAYLDMDHLCKDIFRSANHFLGQTRMHTRIMV